MDVLAEAEQANNMIADGELREAAHRASKATGGAVHFLYRDRPSSASYYAFQGGPRPMTRTAAIGWLAEVATNPGPHCT